MLASSAPAKINLFLHVRAPRPDGYHPIESLVAFANHGDKVEFEPGGEAFSLAVRGPFAAEAGDDENNLVLRAARRLQQNAGSIRGGEFRLTKNLPAGAGLGGGSSDAAAALRLIAQHHSLSLDDAAVLAAAHATGADVSACLEPRARLIGGIGEVLSGPVTIPPLHAVLVWPAVPASTPAVYRAFDEGSAPRSSAVSIQPGDIPGERSAFMAFLTQQQNDLTQAAWRVVPQIAEADAALRAIDGARLVRMSGSGSAVFAIYDSEAEAHAEADALRIRYPGWWVMPTVLR